MCKLFDAAESLHPNNRGHGEQGFGPRRIIVMVDEEFQSSVVVLVF
jgi:hypothetical protein